MIEPLLLATVYGWLLIFCRVGTAFFLMPGIGEAYIPGRIRLALALATSTALYPVVTPLLPAAPSSPLSLTLLIGSEITIGAFLGIVARILLSALHTAGLIIGMQSSLGSAMMFDFTQESQGSSIGGFYALMGLMLIFATDLHHTMLRAVADSYGLFTPGALPPAEDMLEHASRLVGQAFVLALQMCAPVMVVTFVLYVGAGVLARLMPAMPVFFVIVPAQVMISFIIMAITLAATMLWYMGRFDETVFGFTAPL